MIAMTQGPILLEAHTLHILCSMHCSHVILARSSWSYYFALAPYKYQGRPGAVHTTDCF